MSIPKAAAKFAADAEAAGFTVTVNTGYGVSVYVERSPNFNGSAEWAETTVYDSPLSGERLGFRTSGGRAAVRFQGGMTKTARGYEHHRSLRGVRLTLGLGE